MASSSANERSPAPRSKTEAGFSCVSRSKGLWCRRINTSMVSAVTAGNGHFDDGFERTPKKMQSARKALEGGSPVRCLSDSVEAMRFVLSCSGGRASTRLRLIVSGTVEVSIALTSA